MTVREVENERTRAWVLIRSASPEAAAERLYGELGYEPDQPYVPWAKSVVVRADVVDFHYNIVVPVDAESPEALQDLVCKIQKLAEVTETAVLRVVTHYPPPPHAADGYITQEEADKYDDEGRVIVGRQRTSPGLNPWG